MAALGEKAGAAGQLITDDFAILADGGWGKSIFSKLVDFGIPSTCDRDAPQKLQAWVGAFADVPAGQQFQAMFGYYHFANFTTVPDWAAKIFGFRIVTDKKTGANSIAGISTFPRFIMALVQAPLWMMDTVFSLLVPGGCAGGKLGPMIISTYVYGLVSKYIGKGARPTERQYETAWNWVCPNVPCDPSTAIAAFGYGSLTKEEAKGYCRMAGWCDYYSDIALDVAKPRTPPGMLVSLWHRGYIGSKDELKQRLVESGIARGQVNDDYVNAGYTLPGLGQIARALHQCRPTRVGKELEYTDDDATRDIKALGYEDSWIPRLLYLMKADVGHREILRTYYEGQISDDTLKRYLQDDGYAPSDINELLTYYQGQRQLKQYTEAGGPSVKDIVGLVAIGYMSPDVAKSELNLAGISPDQQKVAAQQIIATRQQLIREYGAKAVQAGLKSGELVAQTAMEALAGYGFDGPTAQLVISEWQQEAALANKPASLTQLCQWATSGLITIAEYKARLTALGWSPRNAQLIVDQCGFGARQKAEKAAAAASAKAAKQAQSTAAREARYKAALAKQQAATAARNAKGQFQAAKAGIAAAKSINADVKAMQDLAAKDKLAIDQPSGQTEVGNPPA